MNNSASNFTSRRSFLKAGAGLAGLALIGRSGLGDEGAVGDGYGGLKMGMQSYTLRSLSFDNLLKTMKDDLKLYNVELFPQHMTGMSPTQASEKLAAAGIKAVSWGVVPFSKNSDANRKTFEFAKTMGMHNISCDPDPDAFDSLDKLTEEYKITVAIHDHGPGARWGKIDDIESAIKDHSKMIGLCNDTGHFIRAGEDPMRACEVFKDRMHAMHLKDFKKNAGGNFEDCVLGDGTLDVKQMVKWLQDQKYAGDVLIEYEGGDAVSMTNKCLDRVKAVVAKA